MFLSSCLIYDAPKSSCNLSFRKVEVLRIVKFKRLYELLGTIPSELVDEMEANVWFCLVPVVKVNELIKLVPVLKKSFLGS